MTRFEEVLTKYVWSCIQPKKRDHSSETNVSFSSSQSPFTSSGLETQAPDVQLFASDVYP